ncbi:hypothetical protein GN316_15595 [Xylophilus sp. Kf1]|nr:hypothetical protein [Xylophilus sp. Kf1]
MAVWLKCGVDSIAFDDDIVPCDAMQRLISLDALDEHARSQREALRLAAESAAAERAARARSDAAAVTRLGYAQGRRDALRHWHAEAAGQRAAASARHGELRGRLADMVVQATAQLLRGPALDHYLRDALQALDGLAEAECMLSLTVHPDDHPVARQTVETLQSRWPDGTVVKITVSDGLARGSCLCESPQGYVDASLSLQLATLRQAALGMLQGLRLPGELTDPLPEDPLAAAAPAGAAAPHLPAESPADRQAGPRPPMPAYFSYAHHDDDEDDALDGEDDGFDDDEPFEGGSAAGGGRGSRW